MDYTLIRTVCQEKTKKKYKGVDILSNNVKSVEEIAREERLAYFREWRANNKDKVKKHNATYWQKTVIFPDPDAAIFYSVLLLLL